MSNMKCPFCQQELEREDLDVQLFGCENQNCKHSIHYDTVGTKDLWQELIRTHKELEQSKICCSDWEKQALDYKAKDIALSSELERTHKALEIAIDMLTRITVSPETMMEPENVVPYLADLALKQITALEQKDVK